MPDVLFDCEPLGNEVTRLFSRPLGSLCGGGRRIKTLRDTNVFQSGMLEYPYKFLVRSIRCALLTPDGDAVPLSDRDYWTSTVELIVGTKSHLTCPTAGIIDPILLVEPGEWPKLSHAQQLQVAQTFNVPVGNGEIIPVHMFRKPCDEVAIDTQQSFQVRVNHETENPTRLFLCALQGVRMRFT